MGIERTYLLALASAISLLLLPAATAAGARNDVRVALTGAQPASCADFEFAANERAGACYSARNDATVSLDVSSASGRASIESLRYGMFRADEKVAFASGQRIDGKGFAQYAVELPLPVDAAAPRCASAPAHRKAGTYRVDAEVASTEGVEQSTLVLRVMAANDAPHPWPVGSTDLRIVAPGEWQVDARAAEIPGTESIALAACGRGELNIKAFVVTPNAGVQLVDYVTHSIEAYSRSSIWKVGRREQVVVAGRPAQHLSLEQTIAGKTTPIEKYFLETDGRFAIVTVYSARPGDGDPATWIRVADATR